METITERENRRSKNLHSLTELEADGNVIISLSEMRGLLTTKRGKTVTDYVSNKVHGITYWEPINARTL